MQHRYRKRYCLGSSIAKQKPLKYRLQKQTKKNDGTQPYTLQVSLQHWWRDGSNAENKFTYGDNTVHNFFPRTVTSLLRINYNFTKSIDKIFTTYTLFLFLNQICNILKAAISTVQIYNPELLVLFTQRRSVLRSKAARQV